MGPAVEVPSMSSETVFAKAYLYCAHVIVSARYKEPLPGDTIFLYENVVLVGCDSEDDDPWPLAEAAAQERYCYVDDSLRMEGRPSFHTYEGIRKIVRVDQSFSYPEVTYSELEVAGDDEVAALLARKPVTIICYDDVAED